MTIASETYKVRYSGNDATTVWPFDFKILDESHLLVEVADADDNATTLTLDTHYTVTGEGDDDGGSVTTLDLTALCGEEVLPAGWSITLRRDLPILQATDIINQGGWYPETVEDALDYLTMLIQQLQEQLDRAVTVSPTSGLVGGVLGASFNATLAAALSAADNAEGYRDTAIAQALAAAASAAAALISQNAAAASALSAGSSSSSAGSSATTATGAASTAGTARDQAVTAKNDAVTAKNDAVTAKDLAVAAKDNAQTYAGQALASATAADESADAAAQSALDAQTAAGGGLQGSAGTTDNAIVRANGTDGDTVQASLVTIDDSGSINIPTGQTYKINGTAHTHAAATDTAAGLVELATNAETSTGTDTSLAVTPAGLASVIGSTIQGYDADTAKVDVKQTFTKSQGLTEQSLSSSSGAVTWDVDAKPNATFTLTENVTGWTLSNVTQGFFYSIRIQQHASAAKTVAWDSSKFKGMTGYTMSTGTGKADILMFRAVSTSVLECVGFRQDIGA